MLVIINDIEILRTYEHFLKKSDDVVVLNTPVIIPNTHFQLYILGVNLSIDDFVTLTEKHEYILS
jgi:hypothetical protein